MSGGKNLDTHCFDVIVIGGGLLGCFAARALTRYDLKVALLEKREDLCTGVSRANSAIVYSGCDTKPGSLKSMMSVRAAQGFPELCGELGVRYNACGSVMVCFGVRGAAVLRKKLERGKDNGVRGMRLLTREEVLELEPNIAGNVHSGLFVPDTGTVLPWELCLAAAESAVKNGAEVMLNTEVQALRFVQGGSRNAKGGSRNAKGESRNAKGEWRIAKGEWRNAKGESRNAKGEWRNAKGEWRNAKGQSRNFISADAAVAKSGDGGYVVQTNRGELYARAVVNCAGISADKVLEMASEPRVRIVPNAADYFVLDTKASGHIKHVIFHEPEEKAKGLTLVPTVDGNILIGATEREIINPKCEAQNAEAGAERAVGFGFRVPDNEFFATAGEGLEQLRALVGQVMPSLPMEHVISNFGAVRPNPYWLKRDLSGAWAIDDRSISDFCVIEPDDGPFISFVGIKTPGLTCSNELGEYAAKKIAARLGAAVNERFDPHISPAPRPGDLPDAKRGALIRVNPAYGNIVCRCRGISEGEIIDAIRRFPGAVTLDGVKRRTGADSGRCQGGYCTWRIIEILARELGCRLEDVTKDGAGSNVLIRTKVSMASEAAKVSMASEAVKVSMASEAAKVSMASEAAKVSMASEAAKVSVASEAAEVSMASEAAKVSVEKSDIT